MNYSDSERMEYYLQALGYDKAKDFDSADLLILNTCSIKQKAEDKALGLMKKISRIKKENPNFIVVIAGCMVRLSSSRYSEKRDRLLTRVPEIDIALRTEELSKLGEIIREVNPEAKIQEIEEESFEDYFKISATYSSTQTSAQAFLPISNGCDKFCTYCIVPYSRGREKSRKIEDVFEEAVALTEKGVIEITLIGQTVNSYGLSQYDKDKETFIEIKEEPFVHLLKKLDTLYSKGLRRVRFTSPHPKDMSDQLIDAMGDLQTQMPFLHLPVQSGDDETLKRMNRTYTVDRYREIVKKLREKVPDISITTDIIVGFCDETKKEYKNTYKFFKEMDFEHGYISRYSDRKGTTANRFMKDNIEQEVKRKRWEKLNELLKKQSKKVLKKFLGKTVKVLVETQEEKLCTGRCEHYKSVQLESDQNLVGQIVPVVITDSRQWTLFGELA